MRSGLGINTAISQAKELSAQRQAAGFDQQALDEAARLGYANGSFEDAPDEAADIMEEFYPEGAAVLATPGPQRSGDDDAFDSETAHNVQTRSAMLGWATLPRTSSRFADGRGNGTHSPYTQKP